MTAPVDIISSNTIWLWESLGRQALTSEPPPPSHSINRMPPTPAAVAGDGGSEVISGSLPRHETRGVRYLLASAKSPACGPGTPALPACIGKNQAHRHR